MNSFDMILPSSLGEALATLSESGEEVRVLAGGQDLLGELDNHLAEPAALVNLKRIPCLDSIEWDAEGGLTIWPLVTIAALEREARITG